MNDGLRVEVHVTGCLGGDLLEMVASLDPRLVPRHTVLAMGGEGGRDLAGVLHALERAGIELDRVVL
ncbi:MAG TPA: hypothetical protein VES93_10460 [Ornithinibacter sp.]|nr:hypothetical protein [Ornithinibacter sp.]